MASKRARTRPAEYLPRPYELERKSDYIHRVVNDKKVLTEYTPVKARIAAEREWIRAKDRSVVSVTTSEDQFLVFDW